MPCRPGRSFRHVRALKCESGRVKADSVVARMELDTSLLQEGSALDHPAWDAFPSLAEDRDPAMALFESAEAGEAHVRPR